jgi:CRISPR-associated protein Cas1
LNPLHLSGFGVEILTSNPKPHAELKITVGRKTNPNPTRYQFLPRTCEFDSVILENATGQISLAALRWLSKHNIPVYYLDFDGSILTAILPPQPVKADIRVSQIEASVDAERKLTVAKAIVQAKLARSLQVLEWLTATHQIQNEIEAVRRESSNLGEASTVPQVRTIEGRAAEQYWSAFAKAIPSDLRFQGRSATHSNRNASDPVNAALNYGYGFLKILCRTAINSVGLEPAVGFLHETSYAQTSESLCYDLEEPFRFLVDIVVIQLFQSDKLTLRDFAFLPDDYQYRIMWEAKMRLLDALRYRFNSGVAYKGRTLKWDTVIQEKALELTRYLTDKAPSVDFTEPHPEFQRSNGKEVRERILSLSQSEATSIGIGKSELHYLRRKAESKKPFKLYRKLREKLGQPDKDA